MLRTILFITFFCTFMLATMAFFIPLGVLSLLPWKRPRDRYIVAIASLWARCLLLAAGARVRIVGKEKIPARDGLCFVANHQGSADIPLVLGYLGKRVGIIAKRELLAMPILNLWILSLGCIPIDRKRPKKAAVSIDRGVARIRRGQSMAIFPEGTRSKGPRMNPFRPGALKLATRSEATIVPLTIDGSYRLFEERGRITPADITLTVHDPIETKGMTADERKALSQRLETIISVGSESTVNQQ